MLLTIMPGPDIIYVLLQSISNGKKYGIATALGLVSGIIIHTTLVAFGVSAIIKQSENLFFVLKLLGALYLFYLAYSAYKNDNNILIDKKLERQGLSKLFKQGFIMNVLNPKVSIFFLAFFPSFLYSSEQNTIVQFYVLGFLFMLQALIIFGMVSIMSGYFSNFIKSHSGFNKNIKWIKMFVFIAIGLFILLF